MNNLPPNRPAKLFIISSPSGGGKSSLARALADSLSDVILSISYTTRAPRAGEVNGKDYYFISTQEFENRIEQEKFLEYAKVYEKFYGTDEAWVNHQLAQGKRVILTIDWQGAEQILLKRKDAIGIFIFPPSLQTLETRLKNRKDDPEIIKKRMALAGKEMQHGQAYAYSVVNDNFEQALSELKDIINQT